MNHEAPAELTLNKAVSGAQAVIDVLEGYKLQIRRRIPYCSLFQPTLRATLQADGDGARVDGCVDHGSGRQFLRW
ncbi:MAG: hypothetical protein JNN30_20130 [Rhodanobacteraceae bacterium]|nr:hypothetical protein [Rhodanobacteraceae bacterium]